MPFGPSGSGRERESLAVMIAGLKFRLAFIILEKGGFND